jgi:integrase/recombinase XerC
MAQLLANKPHDALEVRDLALMELFYSSGLRLAELTGLKLRDLDLKLGQVRVLGKGSKERIAPVGSMAIKALRSWLAARTGLRRRTSRRCLSAATARRSGRGRYSCAWRPGARRGPAPASAPAHVQAFICHPSA